MKRALSFLLSLAMGFSVLTVSASAAQKPGPAQETFRIKGRAASSAMVEMLEEEGITVTGDTVIELVPLSSAEPGVSPQSSNGGNGGNMLVITNEEGTTVRQDALVLVTDNGIGFADMNEVMERANHGLSEDMGKIMVHGVAFFDRYRDVHIYYRPKKVQFNYKKYQNCNVSYVGAGYDCSGGVYSYPGFVNKNQPITYSIEVEKYNPVEGTVYGKEDPYYNNRVICTSAGGDSASPGNYLTFQITVDGKSDSYTGSLLYDGDY